MSNKFLPVFASNARYQNQKLLPGLLEGRSGSQDLLTFCRNHRLMGISSLLLLCDTGDFQSHLYRSGRAFLALAGRVEGTWPVPLSRSVPLFDAVAALDLEGARELAARAPRSRRADIEYEEDFLYVRFLLDYLLLARQESEVRALLERFESVLQGSEEPRLAVCKALLERDEEYFQDALLGLLTAEASRFTRLYEQQRLSQEQWATDARVSVEGLALVVLATHAGLRTQDEYPHVPSVARSHAPPREPPDSWMTDGG